MTRRHFRAITCSRAKHDEPILSSWTQSAMTEPISSFPIPSIPYTRHLCEQEAPAVIRERQWCSAAMMGTQLPSNPNTQRHRHHHRHSHSPRCETRSHANGAEKRPCRTKSGSETRQKEAMTMARRRAETRQQPRYSSSFLLFFFLPPPAGRPASFCRCTTRRVHDSSLSHSKPLRYGLSSSSSDFFLYAL